MLKGRLGLETARVPHVDRHGLLWLERGTLKVRDGTLCFVAAQSPTLDRGTYDIPFQTVSCILLAPGTTISHDALRLLARHGTGLLAVGEDGVRFYAAMPFGPDDSRLARRQVETWSDSRQRIHVARRMYAMRMGQITPNADIAVLRGIEGARMKRTYEQLAREFGLRWKGRRYDRNRPDAADELNQAINHAASAVQGAAMIAVAATGTIPQLGFIHEDSGIAFALDIADLFREDITLPIAFGGVREGAKRPDIRLERLVRKLGCTMLRQEKVIPRMIDRIKELLHADDSGGHT